ncbi:MAG: DUF5652 family protein [Patescibacteria group bacterium]|nr:DUF5652 family protein [Patescibacteria group bacterium]
MTQNILDITSGDWLAFSGASVLMIVLIIWALFWKGWALWRAARNGHKIWYIALLILNTVGILEILYIFIWGKSKSEKPGIPPAA